VTETREASQPPPATALGPSVTLVLGAAFMLLADVSILNIAAPSIQRKLGADVGEVQLMIAGYQVAYATALVTGGRLGDIFGRRALLLYGTISFTLASLACGLSQNPGELIGFRVWQGLSAALMYPQVIATLTIVVPPQRLPRAFSLLGAVISSATIVGPVLAGVLIKLNVLGEWRPIFLINVPIGLVVIALTPRLVPAVRSPNAKRLDMPGAALAILAMAALTLPLTVGRDHGWPARSWVSLGCVPLLAGVFLLRERAIETGNGSPLLPPELWRFGGFRIGLLLYVVLFVAVIPFFLYYSIVLQYGLAYDALTAGIAMTPYAIGTLITSLRSTKLVARYDTRNVLISGGLICAAGSLLLALTLDLDHSGHLLAWWMTPAMFVTGLGLGLVVPPLLTFVLRTVPTPDVGAVSGLLSTAQQLGGALGVAVIGVLFLHGLPGGITHSGYFALRGGLVSSTLLMAGCFALAAALVTRLARYRVPTPAAVAVPTTAAAAVQRKTEPTDSGRADAGRQ
jgi:EmrB/QacA subfamily drug resistance transporter